jgi:hypothetical protein
MLSGFVVLWLSLRGEAGLFAFTSGSMRWRYDTRRGRVQAPITNRARADDQSERSEIHGHGLKGFLLQPLQNQLTIGFLLQGYTVIIKLREHPANGRHTGQRFETQNAFN